MIHKYHMNHVYMSAILYIIANVAYPISIICIPALLLWIVSNQMFALFEMIPLFILVICSGICKMLQTYETRILFYNLLEVRLCYIKELSFHNMSIAYEKLEDPKICSLLNKAQLAIDQPRLGIQSFLQSVIDAIYMMILLFLFLLLSMRIHPLFSIFLILVCGVMYVPMMKVKKLDEQKNMETAGWINQRKYLYFDVMANHTYGKEIKTFDMSSYLRKKYQEVYTQLVSSEHCFYQKAFGWNILKLVLLFVMEAGSYAWVSVLVLNGQIPLAVYSLYIGMIAHLFSVLRKFFETLSTIKRDENELQYFEQAMLIPCEQEQGMIKEEATTIQSIEFQNVYFTYPNSNEPVLQGISFRIEGTKKVALVGVNGSGKSTIIKLICRLYEPSQGRILLNGIDIRNYEISVYRKMIAAIFQDVHMYPFTIAENVSMRKEIQTDCFQRVIHSMELNDKISQLEAQENTLLGKGIFDGGVDLSGGQAQRLSVCRALYKNAPILILDEPTSASDPISELAFFELFNTISEHKLCLLVSHRLPATAFCDEIIVLQNGRMIERGTFQELMEMKGSYATLYTTQSSLYQEVCL